MRFIDTASEQISECDGKFELLPPASQTALLNVAFAGDYLRIPDLKAFSDRIRQYFQLSATFMRMSNNWEGIDPELMKHCHILKMQRVSPHELSQYYVEYMKRHALEADPKVINKIKTGEYSKDLRTGYGGVKTDDMWLSPAQLEQKKMHDLQQKLNMPNGQMPNPYGQPPHGGQFMGNAGFNNRGNQGFNNNQFGQPQSYNNFNQHPGQYNRPNIPGFQQQQYQPQQQQFMANQQNYNQPSQKPPKNFNDFAQQQGFGNLNVPQAQQHPTQQPNNNANNFFHNQNQAGNPAMGQSQPPQQGFKINASNPFAEGLGGEGLGHDDIFGGEDANVPKPTFGGPTNNPANMPAQTGDAQMDDFLNQLNDLKNI